jgi:pimeloyl-ACP methyl ester carboxylesterase
VAEFLEELFSFDGRDLLVAIQQSATVMVGTLDLLMPPRHARVMASLMRSAEYVEVRGAGHMIMLETPSELVACLEAASWRSRHPSA